MADPDHLHDVLRRRGLGAEALAAGAMGFLYKPFMEDSLLKTLEKAIQHHEPPMRPSLQGGRAMNGMERQTVPSPAGSGSGRP